MYETLPEGTNLRLLLIHCRCDPSGLTSYASVLDRVVQAVRSCEMNPLTSVGHDFTGAGYSLCVLLAESHLVIHTYPECSESVIVELSVCDHMRSNEARARRLARAVVEIFTPRQHIKERSQMRPRAAFRAGQGHWGALDVERLLAQREDRLSLVTPALGTAQIRGERLVTCELDEPWVTEPLVHVPLLLHPEPRSVILAPEGAHPHGHQEILRHPSVERLTLLDPEDEPGPEALAGQLLDPRLERSSDVPLGHVPPGPVDLVLLDLAGAQDLALLEQARSWLGPGGIWGVRLPAPAAAAGVQGDRGAGVQERRVLPQGEKSAFYWQHLPSGGRSLFAVGGPGFTGILERAQWARRLEQRELRGLQVITEETLGALFALPPLLGSLIAPFMVSFAHG